MTKTEIDILLTALAGAYPELFNPDKRVPLALGMHFELIKACPQMGAKPIKQLLAHWTRTVAYQQALLSGEKRRHLDGSISGKVSAKHVAAAKVNERLAAAREAGIEKHRKEKEEKLARGATNRAKHDRSCKTPTRK